MPTDLPIAAWIAEDLLERATIGLGCIALGLLAGILFWIDPTGTESVIR